MNRKNVIIPEQIAYLCDPKKAKNCSKKVCYKNPMYDEKHGVCAYTSIKEHSKDGKQYVYNTKTSKWEVVE